MKLVKEHINEKFEEGGDPIRQMGIGLRDVYRCGECGNLVDQDGYDLNGEDFELAKKAIQIFGDEGKHMKYIRCLRCQEEEYQREQQEAYERERYREYQREEEEEERRQQDRFNDEEYKRRW